MMATAAATRTSSADRAEIRRALDLLYEPGDVVELRAIRPNKKIISGYYDDLDKLADDAVRINRMVGSVYVIPNRINPALLARRVNRYEDPVLATTPDSEVIQRRWFLFDADPIRPSGISSSNDEHQAALDRAQAVRQYLVQCLGWREPILADSGNGAHLMFRIDLPNNDESTVLVQRCLQALGELFSDKVVSVDQTVYNAGRIWKLYGTNTGKGDPTPDRPHRQARIISIPDSLTVTPREALQALAAMAPSSKPTGQRQAGNGQPFDLERWIQEHGIEVKYDADYCSRTGVGRKWILERCVWNPEHTDKSAWIIQFPSGAVAAGCKHDSCTGKGWHALRDAVEPGWQERREQRREQFTSNRPPEYDIPVPQDDPTHEDEAKETRIEPVQYKTLTCAELVAAKFELRYLIDNILAADQPLLLAGSKKTLKTSLLVDLVISLAMAGSFLGYFKTNEAARVGLMTGESGLPTLQETVIRVSNAAGIDPAGIGGLVVTDDIPILTDLRHLDALAEWIKEYELGLVAIDPFYLALDDSVDAASLFAVGKVLRNLTRVCKDAGANLILCHHTRKNIVNPNDPPELEDIAWAGSQEWARQWLRVSRREKYEPGTGEHRLWLVSGGSAGHGGCWALDINEGTRATPGGRFWDVQVNNADEARQAMRDRQQQSREREKEEARQRRLDQHRSKIVRAMLRHPTGETSRAIRDAAGLSGGDFTKAMASLLEDGTVTQCEITKGNRRTPYDGYKLAYEGTTHA